MLIVDMPMPREGGCHIAVDWDGHSFVCPIKRKTCDYFFSKKRPDWCPIKGELPDEHGDLIDRDVSIQTFKCIEEAQYSGFDGQEAFYAPEDVVNTLLCQDVVIAAERSKQ